MEYLSLKEAQEYTSKSESTLRGIVRGIKAQENQIFEGVHILKFDRLVNRSKKIFILKRYLDHLYKIKPIKTTYQDNTHIDTLNNRYIDRLEKELDSKQKEIDNFLELEAKIIDRFSELQEALKRTQYQLQQQTQLNNEKEERIKQLEMKKLNSNSNQKEIEEAKEVLLSDDPEQLPGQTMLNFEKEQQERLSKHRKDVLSKKMNEKKSDFYDYL